MGRIRAQSSSDGIQVSGSASIAAKSLASSSSVGVMSLGLSGGILVLLFLTCMSKTNLAYTSFAHSINYGEKLCSTVYERNPTGFAVPIASVDSC